MGPGLVNTNLVPGPVNRNLGPEPVNTNLGPWLGARTRGQAKGWGPGNTNTLFKTAILKSTIIFLNFVPKIPFLGRFGPESSQRFV